MSLSVLGNNILINNTVTNITAIGFWLLIQDKEYFVPFAEYPCFKTATVTEIQRFTMLSPTQVHWFGLDCDIELEALEKPQNFPLLYI